MRLSAHLGRKVPPPLTGCAHARFSGTCPACQRAQQARERLHLAQATSRGLRQHHAEPPA